MRRLVLTTVWLAWSALAPAQPQLEIWQIQGTGGGSPYFEQIITTRQNVVTALEAKGFFMQTPPQRSDGDPETSDGIYVYTGATPTVQVGDMVDVTGRVKEYYSLTEIASPVVTVTSSGNPLPPPVDWDETRPSPLRPQPDNEIERYEGMLVRVAAGTVCGPVDQYGEFAAVARSTRAFREKGVAYPAPPGVPVWDGNPEVFLVKPSGLGLPEVLVPAGVPFTAVGPLYYSFDQYKIFPASFTFDGEPAVRPVRARVPGELVIASQNLQRLFDDIDDPGIDEEVVPTEQYQRKLAKLSMLIRDALQAPGLVAVQEVESQKVLQDLAFRIHADEPAITYTPFVVEGNDVGGIDVGYLLRQGAGLGNPQVEQVGKTATFTSGGTVYSTFDRPPLVLRFSFCAPEVPVTCSGLPLTVVNVHLRSLSGIEGTSADFVRAKRYEGAKWLAQYLQGLQTADPEANLLVIGDFNAFQFTDGWVDVVGIITGNLDPAGARIPGTDWVEPDLHDHVLDLSENERYTYIHAGNAQVLDHALTSRSLTRWISGVMVGRVNADAPHALAADASTPLRAADHDPLAVYIATWPRADLEAGLQPAAAATVAGGTVTVEVSAHNHGPFDATEVTARLVLPPSVSLAGTPPAPCALEPEAVVCTFGSLPPGATAKASLALAFARHGTYTPVLVAAAREQDPTAANNDATLTVSVAGRGRRRLGH
ncbi:MAG TPA: hypothetical protein P5234_09555 [Thermoanaerobaculaceae bacterium]|nr:hypothetical protein [Thermoanaerobaculaceae bacterium]HRS16476.1 hypothetical protein [Thermoanaerobaculaceae bacterium]